MTTPNDDNDNNVEAVYDVDAKCGNLITDHYPVILVWPII